MDTPGFTVYTARAAGGGHAFAYTSGLTAIGWPEVIVAGLAEDTVGDVLTHVVGHLISHRTDPSTGGIVEGLFCPPDLAAERIDEGWSVVHGKLRPLAPEVAEAFGIARDRYPGARFVQALFPDHQGRFPGDPGVAPECTACQEMAA